MHRTKGVQVDTNSINRAIAEIIFTALNNRDLSLLDKYLDEHATFDFPGTTLIRGRKKIIIFFKILFRKYSRLTFTVKETIVEGEGVCVLWTNQGSTSNGHAYSNRGVTFVHITDGKILFLSDYFKDTSFTEPG
jgi:ketosteroid isomerase-like protein